MMYETVKYEKKEMVGIIILNRPEKKNTLNRQMKNEMMMILDEISKDIDVRTVVLYGNEKFFGAGADIVETSKDLMGEDTSGTSILEEFQEMCFRIENLGKPVIAAIGGYALGGSLEMAMSCDILVASRNAKMGLPEVKIGTIPGAGGTQRLPRIIGSNKAKELLFTGDIISGEEAYRIGLVNHLTQENEVFDFAYGLAYKMSKKAPLAMAQAKKCVNKGMQLSIEEGMDLEARCSEVLSTSDDLKEGIDSFINKRKPQFTGK